MALLELLVTGFAIVVAFTLFIIVASLFYNLILLKIFPQLSSFNKENKRNQISENDYEKLAELYLDASNLYSCPETSTTKKAATGAKATAITIGKLVNDEQKKDLISQHEWVIKMGRQSGLKKIVLDKNDEILEIVKSQNWSFMDAVINKNLLNSIDKKMLNAINKF